MGHMEYLLAGKERCDYLIIGIANPDPSHVKPTRANPNRSKLVANPLTYYERFEMIQRAMLEAGLSKSEFDIVPFPINFPELIFDYAPREAKYYMTIYDEWGREKYDVLKGLGCDVEVMWIRTVEERITSGSEVRKRIARGEAWAHLVPPSVYAYMIENKIDMRIKELLKRVESC